MNLSQHKSSCKLATRLMPGLAAMVVSALCVLVVAADQSAGETTPSVTRDTQVESVSSRVPVGVWSSVDRSSAQIADKITLTLVVRSPLGVQISLPEASKRLGEFDVVNVRDTLDIPVEDGRESTRTYELECLASGGKTIPSVAVAFVDARGTKPVHGLAKSEPVNVSITSLLEGQADPAQFRDIKGVVELHRPPKRNTNGLLIAGGIGTLLAGAGAFVILRNRNATLSPEQWALQELKRVESQSSSGHIDVQTFYMQITTIVRIYVEGEFGIDAPRLTTAEFFERVQHGRSLEQDHVLLLREFLTTADMVKFAGLLPQASDISAACLKARQFVEESSCNVAKQEIV